MKTFYLVNLLSPTEKKELHDILHERKRSSLTKLFKFLQQNELGSMDKEALYKATFSTKYDNSKDYLLRNELRLLNNEIEKLISAKEAELQLDSVKKGIFLLERMLRKNDVELFKNVFAETERAAKSAAAHEDLIKLYELKIKYGIKNKELAIANLEETIEDISLKINALSDFMHENEADGQLRKNFALRSIQNLDTEKFNALKEKPLRQKKTDSLIVKYLNLYAATYFLSGEEKINQYKELIKQHSSIVKIRPERQIDLAAIYGNMALELFLESKYKEADKYYLTAIKNSTGTYLELYFNYCVNALLIGKHKEVTELYNKHFEEINKNEKIKYRFGCFAAIAYLMLGKTDVSFKMLHHEITQRPVNEYYYYRLVFAMVYYQRNDMENAEREIENILQSFRFRKTARLEDKPLVKLIKKMIDAESFKQQKEKYTQETKKLKQELESLSKEQSKLSIVIYNWVAWQITKK